VARPERFELPTPWFVAGVSSTARAQASNLIDLGVTTGYALNDSGQVALASGIYSNGVVTALPALPGSTTPATPLAINASGQVAGVAPNSTGSTDAVAYINGVLTDISALTAEYLHGSALLPPGAGTGINSSDEVVGWYQNIAASIGFLSTNAFTFKNEVETDLPAFACNPGCNLEATWAYGLNDSGQIIGAVSYTPCPNITTAIIYTDGSWAYIGPGAGYAINAGAEATGTLSTVGSPCETAGTVAFLRNNNTGGIIRLGTLPGGSNSIGYAINATGQIVGSSDYSGGTATHAFFYNGVITDLNALIGPTDPLQSFVTLTSAVGINDSFLILANGVDSRSGGLQHAYLLQGPAISFSSGSLYFVPQAVGVVSAAQSLTIKNAGSGTIGLGAISVSANFTQKNTCSASLAPSATCTVSVTFTPAVAGGLDGALTISSAGINYSVALSGVARLVTTISASSGTQIVGRPLKLMWNSSPGSTCTASSNFPTWGGSIPRSGSRILTETKIGYASYSISCTAGGILQNAAVVVGWSYPPVTTKISAAPTTITAGGATTLTWSSTNATTCTATGGGSDDKWPGTKAPSGSQTVTETFAGATPSVITFGITCNSSTTDLSAQASVSVMEESSSTSGSGGGGAVNLLSLVFLAGTFAFRCIRDRIASS
jgi:probable HAF family extracellular repeat protein